MPYLIDAHHVGLRQTGNETWIRNVARELPAMADPGEFRFVSSSAGTATLKGLTGVTPLTVSGSSVRRLALDLPRLAKRTGADAVLVQYTTPLTSTPCVVMIHDLSAFDPMSKQWLTRRFRMRVQASIRDSVRRAARLLAPSEFTRQQLVDICGADPARIDISVNAVDPDLIAAIELMSRKTRRDGRHVVLAVGNVLPRKNLGVLGHALAQLRMEGADVHLRVVGSVPTSGQATVHQLRSLLDDALTVTGYVALDGLAMEYANADLLAFPSLFEGFGIPVLEGLAAGLPVIVSDRGSLPEIVGAAGTVVPAQDPKAWAMAVAQATTRGTGDIEAGRKRAESFSWHEAATVAYDALRKARSKS